MKKNKLSQIAVIVTLFIALIFIFAVVFINIYRVSNVKIITSQAADRAALSLASKIGSIAAVKYGLIHYESDLEYCDWDYNKILGFLAKALPVLGAILFLITLNPIFVVLGYIGGAIAGMAIMPGIINRMEDMSEKNRFREEVLFTALSSAVNDDVNLIKIGPARFQDPVRGDIYDLSSIPQMSSPLVRKVNRFLAWYYLKRLPSVDDSGLIFYINYFINDPTGGLVSWVEVAPGDWNPTTWRIEKVSYYVRSSGSDTWSNDGDVWNDDNRWNFLATSTAPSWVKDATHIRILKLNTSDQPDGGFLTDKFIPLLQKIKNYYPAANLLDICENGDPPSLTNCPAVQGVINDLQEYATRAKEIMNMPVNERLRTLQEWYKLFYDETKHVVGARCSIDDVDCNPDNNPYTYADKDLADSLDKTYKYDSYLQLWRDQVYIKHWIAALETVDKDLIIPPIPPDYGSYCEEGHDVVEATCYTEISTCCCSHEECDEYGCWTVCDGDTCTNEQPARWYGEYATCTGSGFDHSAHPVCNSGDLYGGIPAWCSDLRNITCQTNSDGCCTDCSVPSTVTAPIISAYYFQGQLSHQNRNNSSPVDPYSGDPNPVNNPTEIGQALKILNALYQNLLRQKLMITTIDSVLYNEAHGIKEEWRNKAVYAWTDRSSFSHFVSATMFNYPAELPYIDETRSFWLWGVGSLRFCRRLNFARGDFSIRVQRYDQDQPTAFGWLLRRRQAPALPEYNLGNLQTIVNDALDDGIIDNATRPLVDDVECNFAISSSANAHFGPTKQEVYLNITQ